VKVLQVIQKPQLRGAEIFACQLTLELQKSGVEVDVVYLFGDVPADWPFKSLNIRPLHGNQKKRFWDFAGYRKLARMISQGGYHLVQANAGDTLKYAVLAKKLFGFRAPLVYRNANKMSDFFTGSFHRKLNQWFLSACDYFISVSENCRQDLMGIVKKASHNSVTIPIGTYLFNDVRSLESRSGDYPVILNVGSLVPEKNHIFLIDVFAAFFSRHKKGCLWIVGDGRLRMALEEKVRANDLVGRVKFWGYRNDVISILKSADVMLVTSKIEGLPAVILEAMACEVPVVSSDVGGIPEIIDHGISGYCIKEWNIQEYLSCLELSIFNTEGRNMIIGNGRKTVADHYLMAAKAQEFKNIYQQILAQKI